MFLNARVAFWVAVGIPVSFMAALGALWAAGGSINMISLFAFIMTVGIIVDDAIVVGEDGLTHHERGAGPAEAAERGARRMFVPVVSSSMTTIAAFVPLMMVTGFVGQLMFQIPLVVICVIAASLVESFLILPGHLRGSFAAPRRPRGRGRVRAALEAGIAGFRERVFRPAVRTAVAAPAVVIALGLALLIVAAGLVRGGHLKFHFFPTPEVSFIYADVRFVAGTPPGTGAGVRPRRGAGVARDGAGAGRRLREARLRAGGPEHRESRRGRRGHHRFGRGGAGGLGPPPEPQRADHPGVGGPRGERTRSRVARDRGGGGRAAGHGQRHPAHRG